MDKETTEIAKLTERISKDPKSRLFVPLAEEYKKAGDIEMAIHVLSEGLKNNPGYSTAKYFLGRLFLERGDTAAARKEFEEVVEAIPDNLPAHKKLAELFALQGNKTDALKHFKIVLALNPGDEQSAAEVSELEATLDAQHSLNSPKPGSSPEPAPALEQQSVSQQSTGAQSAPEMPEPADSGVTDRAFTSGSATSFMEPEEAEEVLIVEPLEDEVPSMEAVFSDIDFLSQQDEAGAPASAAEEQSGGRPAEGGPQKNPEEHEEEASFPSSVFEESASGPFGDVAAALPEQETASWQTGEASDDFTTDTLAELYIAQGFYEKAIDIYQRMLTDHPGSRGLMDKLERVRAMAVSSDAPSAAEPEEPSPVDREEEIADYDLGLPDLEEPSGPGPVTPDFVPREYVPPGEDPFQADEGPLPVESRMPPEDPGKAIARLEKWLVNIAKER